MILSVHIPKAAGNTFASALKAWYGERVMRDYGDVAGYNEPEWNARRNERKAAARANPDRILSHYDVIHGHYVGDKYLGLFPEEYYVAFFRNPYEQSISHYEFLLRSENVKNPIVSKINEEKMTFEEFLAWEEVANPQTQFVGEVPIESFAFVGLSEEFDRGIELFNAVLAARLESGEQKNTNPNREGYQLSDERKKLIEKHRAADLELFEKVKTHYNKLLFKYDC